MALLTPVERDKVTAALCRALSEERIPAGYIRDDLRAAVDATDQWIEDNQASFNAALPQPFRGVASQQEKALILLYVVWKRFGWTPRYEE